MSKYNWLLALLFFSVVLTSCTSLKEIEISQFRNFEIVEFKDNALTLRANIEIDNPNSLRMKITDAKFDLMMNDKKIGHLSQMDNITLLARTKKEYPVTAKFEITSLKNGLLSLMQIVNRRDSRVSVSGSVTGRTFLYRKTFEFKDIKLYQ